MELAALADVPDATRYLQAVQMALRGGLKIPAPFHDHALRGKLKGMRSVVIGEIDDASPSFILIHRLRGSVVDFLVIDQHDDAYLAG